MMEDYLNKIEKTKSKIVGNYFYKAYNFILYITMLALAVMKLLKVPRVEDLSWWIITIPIWLPIAFVFGILVLIVIFVISSNIINGRY